MGCLDGWVVWTARCPVEINAEGNVYQFTGLWQLRMELDPTITDDKPSMHRATFANGVVEMETLCVHAGYVIKREHLVH